MPHAPAVGVLVHTDPLQHPVVQVTLQPAQAPPEQASPAPHAAQAAPPAPHAAAEPPGRHALPEQQPVHELASQTHAPCTQCWPAEQAAPVPQLQLPAASQRSAIAGSQARHCAPGAAHSLAPIAVHTLPAQHPAGQVVASHTHAPSSHRCPVWHAAPPPQLHVPSGAHRSALAASHALHVAPGGAHVPAASAWHVAPSQQPLGHDVASHTHSPPTQRCPVPQTGPVPQAHDPPTHASARSASQAMQALPLLPQAVALGALHVVPLQHPLAQLAAQLAQTPASHAEAPQD